MGHVSQQAQKSDRLVVLSSNPFTPALIPRSYESTEGVAGLSDAIVPGALTRESSRGTRRWDETNGIIKLVLQVAHSCNLTCSYCCSDAGRWGAAADTGLMSPEVATEAVRFFAETYREIQTIYLFGGEPLLNLPAVEAVCDEVERLVEQGTLGKRPDIGLTTNGTILNEHVVRILRERPYLKVSVSLDGTAATHDRFRIDTHGRPTYSRVVRNIHALREQTGRPKLLELTYGLAHQDSDKTLWNTLRAMHCDTGVGIIAVEIAYNTEYSAEQLDPLVDGFERTLVDVEDAISQSIESITTSAEPTYFYHVIAFAQVLFKQHGPNFCPAARNYFTVAKDGAIYPCQNLPENGGTLIGRLGEADLSDRIRTSTILKVMDEANRRANDEVGDEWYANFCKICPVYNLSENRTLEALASRRIQLQERMASAYVRKILPVVNNALDYERFLSHLAEKQEDTFELNVF